MTITVIGDNTGDDFSGTEDTWLKEDSPTINQNGSTLSTRLDTFLARDYAIVLKFSGLSNISASEIVSAAAIMMYLVGGASLAATIEVRRLLRTIVETQATWNIAATSLSWTASGARSDGNDRSGTLTASTLVTSTASWYVFSSAQLITDCQNEVDGTNPIRGHLFEQTSLEDAGKNFAASEGTDGQRPYVSVTHAVGVSGIVPFRRRIEGY